MAACHVTVPWAVCKVKGKGVWDLRSSLLTSVGYSPKFATNFSLFSELHVVYSRLHIVDQSVNIILAYFFLSLSSLY